MRWPSKIRLGVVTQEPKLPEEKPKLPTVQRTVILSAEEAQAFADAMTAIVGYLAENFATARLFCGGPEVVSLASGVALVASKMRKSLSEGTKFFSFDQEVMIGASRLSECSVRVTRHLSLVTHLSLIGSTLTVVGGMMLKSAFIGYAGLGFTIASQLFGPSIKIPLLE